MLNNHFMGFPFPQNKCGTNNNDPKKHKYKFYKYFIIEIE